MDLVVGEDLEGGAGMARPGSTCTDDLRGIWQVDYLINKAKGAKYTFQVGPPSKNRLLALWWQHRDPNHPPSGTGTWHFFTHVINFGPGVYIIFFIRIIKKK